MQHSQQRSTNTDTDRSRSPSAPLNGAVTTESPVTDALAAYTRDPFSGFFDGRTTDEIIASSPLLDVPTGCWYIAAIRAAAWSVVALGLSPAGVGREPGLGTPTAGLAADGFMRPNALARPVVNPPCGRDRASH